MHAMKSNQPNLNDRLSASAAAKKAPIEGFKAKRDDPETLARQAAQKEISVAREARRSQRKADKEAEAARLAAEAAAHVRTLAHRFLSRPLEPRTRA